MAWLGLSGRHAIVTGGASGIGRAAASALLDAGARLTIMDFDESRLLETKDSLEALSGKSISHICVDVSNGRSVSAAFDSVPDGHILVNCAGITRDNFMVKLDEAAWDSVVDINLKGSFLTTQAFARKHISNLELPNTIERTASIINISSIVGKTGNRGQANYSASKAGVIGMTKTMALELAQFNVRVNALLPGFIATPMAAAVPEKVMNKILPGIPMKRIGQPEEVADAILFLASERSSYISGTAIEVSGGSGV